MSNVPPSPLRIAVIGGGIAGLAAAHRLTELAPQVEARLFEAGPRLGGVLQTEQVGGYLLDRSADMFITSPSWALDLCRRIGLADDLIKTDDHRRGAFVVRGGRLHRVPDGFVLMQPRRLWPLVKSPLLSLRGKLRMLSELFVPPRKEPGDESLAAFVRRRLGNEAYDRLVQPLVGGIYTADGEQLSLAATLPRFIEMERKHGGLIKAALRGGAPAGEPAKDDASGARYSLFMTPRKGMQSLVDAVAARLPSGVIRLNTPVERLFRSEEGRWQLETESAMDDGIAAGSEPPDPRLGCFDAVLIALPARRAADLLREFDHELSSELSGIRYADSAVTVVGYRREQIAHPLDAFGLVVPDVDKRQILAASFASVKFPGRAPEGSVLIRVFIGGARRPELAALPDEELRRITLAELGELLGARGEPELFRVIRWRGAMPQYRLGHLDRVSRIETRVAALPQLALAGSAYRGVGIPDCIRSGEQAAERLLKGLGVPL